MPIGRFKESKGKTGIGAHIKTSAVNAEHRGTGWSRQPTTQPRPPAGFPKPAGIDKNAPLK